MSSFAIEVPGEAVPLNLPDLCKALQAGNSNNQIQRQAASKQLEEWQSHQNYFSSLQAVYLDRTLPYEVRFLAIILLKNGIERHWRGSQHVKGGLHPDEKALIRSRLLQAVDEEEKSLALHNALAAAKIIRLDYPHEWPTALSDIIALLRNVKDNNPAALNGALLVLLRAIKELGSARLRRSQTALQHTAEELFYVLGEIYTANTAIWLEFLLKGRGDEDAVDYAMASSLTALKILRHLMLTGFEQPHSSKLVVEFWSLSQTQFDQFLGYVSHDSAVPAPYQEVIGKHLLKFTKLHIDMSEIHPASFATLPNSVALVRAYWGLVANFAEVYTKSAGLRQSTSDSGAAGSGDAGAKSTKLEGPLLEKLALKGLLLLKSCIQIITQPMQTFKYRNAETQKHQAEGVQLLKTELFTNEFILQVIDVIITKLFIFRQPDLEAWEEDPEEWEAQESESGTAWEYQVRPCAERVFLSLLIHNKELLAPPLLAYFQKAMNADTDLLTKEAVYTAMGNAAVAIDKAFDFDAFLRTTLVKDAQVQGPMANVLRRRVAILLGSWAFYELSDESIKLVYTIYTHLLNKNDPANDLVVRLTATRHLKTTVDDMQFRSVYFEPYAATVFTALIDLIGEVENDETKLTVLETMRAFIERMETIVARFSDGVMAALPSIWESSKSDTYMIKQSVLSILSTLIMAVGQPAHKYHDLILPIIADAMNPSSPVHQFLFEEAVDLWNSVMQQSFRPLSRGLIDLLPMAVHVLDYDSHLVQMVLEIVDAYIVLAPDGVLSDQFRQNTLAGLARAMEAKKWEQVKAAATGIQKLIRSAVILGGVEGASTVLRDLVEVGLLPRILERLHGAWEAHQTTGPKAKQSPISTTTQVEYVIILSRLALADPGSLVDMLSSGAADLPSVWRWLVAEWFGTLDNMGNPEHNKIACLALTRLLELQQEPVQSLVLGQLQDYFSMWTTAVVNAQGDANGVDCFVWSGPPQLGEFDTPLVTVENEFAAKDPLHTETTYNFIMLRLQDLIARTGGEKQFEENWAVNVDKDVLAGFRDLSRVPTLGD